MRSKRVYFKVDHQRYYVHAVFECSDCGKRWEDFKNARLMAWHHCRETGHHVTGETGIGYHYSVKK